MPQENMRPISYALLTLQFKSSKVRYHQIQDQEIWQTFANWLI